MRFFNGLIFVSFATIIIGCGKTLPGATATSVGATFSASPSLVDEETTGRARVLCQALQAKEANLRLNYLSSDTRFNFSTVQKSCNGESRNSAVQTRLGVSGGQLRYEVVSGDYFITQVETASAGTVSPLCSNLGQLTQPLMIGSEIALRFELGTNGEVRIETGTKQDNGQFLIKKVDDFKVELNSGANLGMVTRHEHLSSDVCEPGKALSNISVYVGQGN